MQNQHYRDHDSGGEDEDRRQSKQQRKDGGSASASAPGGGPHPRKPSGPPVKAACLACRKAKGKCDGVQPICGNCVKKGIPCEFVKSRRGGARKKKLEIDTLNEPLAVFLQTLENLGSYSAHQGAGGTANPPSSLDGMTTESVTPVDKVLKVYNGPDAILTGYYSECYPYCPLFPAPGTVPNASIIASLGPSVPYLSSISPGATPGSSSSHSQSASRSPSSSTSGRAPSPPTLQAKNSPLLLAILSILVLVPHPEDPKPDSDSSRMMRRTASARYAAESLRLVNEYTDRAGNEGDDVPLEVVQSLVVLAKWEMGQRGNFAGMRSRMGTAVQVAMDLGLHRSDANILYPVGEEWKRDVRRRTWWMVFSDLMQASVISGTLPSISPYDARVTAEFPGCAADPEVWRRQMNTLRQVVRAFELVVSDNYPDMSAPDPVRGTQPAETKDKKSIHQEMVLIDRRVLALLKDAEKRGLVEVRKGMGGEAELARNFALSTRMMLSVIEIVLHRSAAFPEVALFSKRMCGMPAIGKAPPPSAMIGRPIGDHHSAILLDHFSTVAKQQVEAREQEAASRPKQPKQSSSKGSSSSTPSVNQPAAAQPPQQQSASFPTWTPPSAEPSVAGWAPSHGHSNGNGNGNGNGAAKNGHAQYPPQVQQFDLASSSSFAPTVGYPAPTNAYPDFFKQVYQTNPHHQAPFSLPYNQIPNPPAPQQAPNAGYYPPQSQPHAMPSFNFNANGHGQHPQPNSNAAYDLSHGGSHPYAPIETAPKLWWEVDDGARAMLMPLDDEPFAPVVLGSGIVGPGPGYPYSDPAWMEQMQGMGAPGPDISLGSYNPTANELERQRQFDQQHQRNQKQHQQPQQQGGLVQSPGSQSSSYGIRAVSESPSAELSEDSSASTTRAHQPWGLSDDLKPISHLVPPPKPASHKVIKDVSVVGGLGASIDEGHIEDALVVHSSDEQPGPFPPGLSLARTSAAAHSVVRLEILHRSAQFSLLEGSPRALPFCACGLVSAAHAFLLLAVAVQAGDRFTPSTDAVSAIKEEAAEQARRKKEVDGLYTNVKIVIAGLRKYGSMWEGINAMATEVQTALDKAQSLTTDMANYHRQQAEAEMDAGEQDAEGEEEEEEEETQVSFMSGAYTSGPPTNDAYYNQGASAQEFWLPQQGQI